jgi:hypothetical protein
VNFRGRNDHSLSHKIAILAACPRGGFFCESLKKVIIDSDVEEILRRDKVETDSGQKRTLSWL